MYARLLFRQSDATQLLIAELKDAFRTERLAGKRGEAFKNRCRGLAIQLLVDDRLRQAGKLRRSKFHAAWAHAVNNGTQDRIGFLEVMESLSHGL